MRFKQLIADELARALKFRSVGPMTGSTNSVPSSDRGVVSRRMGASAAAFGHRWAAKALVSAIAVLAAFSSRATERQTLPGHVPGAVARLQALDRLPSTNRLHLAIGLPLRNREALTNYLLRLYDPASANYRRYLTPAQFAESYGPTEQDYQSTIAYAQANGLVLTHTHPNRLLLDVEGAVADVERTFQVTMRVYPHPTEARTFFAPDTEPTLNTTAPILHISGLDNYTLPHPQHLREIPTGQTAGGTPRVGSGPSSSFMGNDFRAAYIPGTSLTRAGQAVGLFELDGYYSSDIASYETQAGLPNVALQNVLIDGFNGVPSSRRPGSGNEEVALDIEMTISMAPGLDRVLVYESSPAATAATIDDLLNRMATDNLARQLSCSWGFDIDVLSQQTFLQYAAQGQSFFLASGDSGAFAGPVFQPSDNPYITVVGGTELTTGSSGAWVSETTWNGSSGGISTIYPIPSWQQGISMSRSQGSITMRNLPDVAMVAHNVWVMADRGRTFSADGTSISSPLWAAFTALVNQQAVSSGKLPVGFINPAIYAIGKGAGYATAFHDITTGNNTNSGSPTLFSAVPGYDLCTGWGSPYGTNLIDALLAPPTDALLITSQLGFAASGPLGGPFNISALTYSLTNAGTAPLNWALLNSSPWLNATPSSGTLNPGGPAASVTVALNSAASNLLIGTYTATVTFTNLTESSAQVREFSLAVGNPGFETGDFTDWNLSADSQVNFADPIDYTQQFGSSNIPGVDDSLFVHSGLYGAFLGQGTTLGTLSQTLPTTTGGSYRLAFWLANPAAGTPNEFSAAWNGTALFDQVNLSSFGWTNMQFTVTATGSSTVLQFGFRNDQNAFALDDISVQSLSVPPTSAPIFQSVTQINGTITFTWSTVPGSKYQVQYTTDLNQTVWNDLGAPIAAVNATASASDVISASSQRSYRIVLVQ
jgi:hypothetical protein